MPQMESAAKLRRRYSDIELIISCGDMPPVYLEFITSVLSVPLFYVRGNHDERTSVHLNQQLAERQFTVRHGSAGMLTRWLMVCVA